MYFNKLVPYIALTFLFTACKKTHVEEVTTSTPPVVAPPVALADTVLKDSAFALGVDHYLWNTQIPSGFNSRSYEDPNKLMEAIRPYSKETGFATAVDRFSYAIKKEEWDNISEGRNSVSTGLGTDGDFGLTVFFRVAGDLRVRLVEPNSPAGKAGIHRGWRITRINGNTSINTNNSTFIIDNVYNSASSKITFQKPDGSSVDIDLDRAHYNTKPIYLDSVYTVNNKKVGYLVFNSFLGKTAELYSGFQRVFNKFSSQGISDVIVDLRYNGGGYVSVQEKLANYLVNSSANGGVMMKQVYNTNHTSSNSTTKFSKIGSLNLSRIYFIVGRSTASASELLISNLKPYMEVKLVGATTYGKPVGFFPIPVGDWYIFPVSFRTTNKNGEGNYFNGIPANNNIADGLDKDWGDLSESCLANVIKNISTGQFRPQAEPEYIEPASVAAANKLLEEPMLKFTIGSTPPSSKK